MRINYKVWKEYWEGEMREENAAVVYVSAAEAITHNGQYSDNQKAKMMEALSNAWNKHIRK